MTWALERGPMGNWLAAQVPAGQRGGGSRAGRSSPLILGLMGFWMWFPKLSCTAKDEPVDVGRKVDVSTQSVCQLLPAWPSGSAGRQVSDKREKRAENMKSPQTLHFQKQAACLSHSPKLNISASFSFQKAKLRSM